MDDLELIRRAQAGDRHAFGALFDAYYGCVYQFLSDRLGGSPEAEDLCQEVFLDVLGSIDQYRCGGDVGFDEWLLRVARRVTREHHRAKAKRDRTQSAQQPVATAMRLNPAAVALLSDQQRQIALYRYNAGLSIRQTAAALHVETAFVQRLARSAMATWIQAAPKVDDLAE